MIKASDEKKPDEPVIVNGRFYDSYRKVPKSMKTRPRRRTIQGQIFCMPPSTGKSRVIAGVCTIMQQRYGNLVDQIVIYFPSRVVLETDEPLYKDMRKILSECKLEVKLVHTASEVICTTTPNSLLIIDEVDYYVFDQLQRLARCAFIVGFTATAKS